MISLAYSPCPNDTFLFYHLVRKNDPHFPITEELHDVEKLNEFAQNGIFPVTKLSFAAYFMVMDKYILLETGSALGKGCGPLLVRKKGSKADFKNANKVYVPGLKTTANLLLSLYTNGSSKPEPKRYDEIIPLLTEDENSIGVIIHEERFTYETRGLEIIVDLGEEWEKTTGNLIPLGAIAIRRDIPRSVALEFQNRLRKSLETAYLESDEMMDYIKEYSQNKDEAVIKSHINLYVNEYTKNLGENGHKAIEDLLRWAVDSGFIQNPPNLPLFLGET